MKSTDMSTVESLEWRYATKKFDAEKKLSKAKIDILKKAFNLTPTSYGLQPLKLIVISNKRVKKELLGLSYYQKQVETASHLLIFCIETDLNEDLIHHNFNLQKEIRNTPDEILDPYRSFLLEHFDGKSTQQVEDWAVNQVYLAMGNLLNVCAKEGIDACPMEGFETEKVDAHLNLKEKNLKSILMLPIGYRSKDDMFAAFGKVRKPLDDVIIEIE